MNEKEQEFEGLDLEDILKEFGDHPEEPEASEPVAPAPQPEELEEIPVEVPAGEANEEPEEESEEDRDTIRLDDVIRSVRAETAKDQKEDQEPDEEEPEKAAEAENPDEDSAEETEEDSDEEDETVDEEEDVEEITHRPPIIFDPRARLRELKKQLIAGPEKRYYELSEIGVGKLQVAMLVCLAVILLSAFAGSLYALDLIPESRLRLMIFCQILAMLVGALMGSYQILDGIADLFHGKFTMKTMLFVTFLACCADGVLCLRELRVPICAAFTLEVAMALWSEYHRRSVEMGEMDTLRKAIRLDSVVRLDDYYQGKPGILRGEGDLQDYMEHYQKPTAPERVQSIYALTSLGVSIAVAVVAGVFHSASMGVQIFSTTLLVAVPAGFFVATTRPKAILERRLHSLGTVLCGWQGVKALCTKAYYPLQDADIFPLGSVKMNGVKFYGQRNPEEIIAYAAALMSVNGGSLVPAFQQLRESHDGPQYQVENFRYYDGGVGGEVQEESVIMGSSKFLQDMGVEIPAGTMVNHAVYVAIDGEFSGLFAINYARMKHSASGMATLCGYRGLRPLIMTDDFIMTASFLKEKFGVSTRRMVFPTREERKELAGKISDSEPRSLALTTHEGLAPAAYAVTGARALRMACRIGLGIHMAGGILGMLIMAALAVIGAVELLTPLNILLYQLIWLIPGLLVTEWTRAI